MSDTRCELVVDCLPEWVARRGDPEFRAEIEEHLSTCGECRAEADLLEVLLSLRPESPDALAEQVQRVLREVHPIRRVPSWGLSAAAVLILSLGTGLVWSRMQEGSIVPASSAGEEISQEVNLGLWPSDDGMVAGSPTLEGLTDEVLLALLEEMEG
jgi:predicted anti-sigma-YlaC factor YlaD